MTQNGSLDHGATSLINGGAFVITTPVSVDVTIESVPIYAGSIIYTFLGGSAPGFVDGTVVSTGPHAIIPAAASVIVDGQPVARENDSGIMLATGSLIGGGTGPVSGVVEVADAGQEEVDAV